MTAVDSGRLSSTALVKVIFVHNNQPPTITNLPGEITLPEDTASGAVVYRVTAEDADGDDVTIRMTVMEGGGRVFTFNKTGKTFFLRKKKNCLRRFLIHNIKCYIQYRGTGNSYMMTERFGHDHRSYYRQRFWHDYRSDYRPSDFVTIVDQITDRDFVTIIEQIIDEILPRL